MHPERLALIAVLLAAAGVASGGCRAAAPSRASTAAEATLTYSGGLAAPAGVRLREERGRVRAVAFGASVRLTGDTARLREALRRLTALAAAPPDSVPQSERGVEYLCADRVTAYVVARRAGIEYRAADAHCRGSDAEIRYRRAVDSVYASLTRSGDG